MCGGTIEVSYRQRRDLLAVVDKQEGPIFFIRHAIIKRVSSLCHDLLLEEASLSFSFNGAYPAYEASEPEPFMRL